MNTSNKIYIAIIVVLLLFVFLLSFLNLESQSEIEALNDKLTNAQKRSQEDSISLINYKNSEDEIYNVLLKKGNINPNQTNKSSLSFLLDTFFKKETTKNDSLKRQINTLKNTVDTFVVKNKEFIHQDEEKNNTINNLQSELKNKVSSYEKVLDSLLTQIAYIENEAKNTTWDTLTLTAPKGSNLFFYGNIVHNKPEGFGIGFYEKKGYYIGQWKGNSRNGKGKHFYKNGDVYEGNFEDDLRKGYGIYYYASGEIFKGQWEKDLMHGEGRIYTEDGKSFLGTWVHGKMKEEKSVLEE